jgi:hypothetical protein
VGAHSSPVKAPQTHRLPRKSDTAACASPINAATGTSSIQLRNLFLNAWFCLDFLFDLDLWRQNRNKKMSKLEVASHVAYVCAQESRPRDLLFYATDGMLLSGLYWGLNISVCNLAVGAFVSLTRPHPSISLVHLGHWLWTALWRRCKGAGSPMAAMLVRWGMMRTYSTRTGCIWTLCRCLLRS